MNEMFAREKRRLADKYADYDTAKTKAAELDRLQEASATELEKAVKAADAAARADVTAKTNARLVGAEVKAAAAHAGFNDPGDAVIQLGAQIAGVKVGDDGQVDEDAVKALVAELAQAKPYLVKQADARQQPLPGQGLHQPSRTAGSDEGKAEAARRFGKPPARP
ncbi:hypothetical protein [Saccharothrix violaceirubra]|uniref:Minor structural protein GP20 n=1 Tax=Saccharothrix violaceirubra TaxID=413306 RepID=A0A7W7SZH7_9PSEU|nr:hypothetical protein [Saccharothrix violaceirubra]MBB4963834.1 hypothetical protein [Saccharothrix violaceirubra]